MELNSLVSEFVRSLNDVDGELLSSFASRAGLWEANRGNRRQQPPPADAVNQQVYAFLGNHMIKEFDTLSFIEETGIWQSGLHNRDDFAEQEDFEDSEAMEAKYLPIVYEAAANVVLQFLRFLTQRGVYTPHALHRGILIAEKSVDELPRCALLAKYLPGPLNTCKDIICRHDSGEDTGGMMDHGIAYTAASIGVRFTALDPEFDFKATLEEMQSSHLQVARTEHRRLHIVKIDHNTLTFKTCRQVCRPWAEPECGVVVPFDTATASLFRPGMVLTGAFNQLADESWYFSEPGYVWPSWYCTGDCMTRYQQEQQAEAAA